MAQACRRLGESGAPSLPAGARGKQPCQPSPASSWHLAPRRAARAHCKLPSASPLWFSSGPAVTCSLDFCCKQLCQRVASGGPGVRAGVGGWHAGGCLSAPPSVSGSLWAAATAAPGDPDGHTSSVCWPSPTCPALPSGAAINAGGSNRRRRVLGPSSPPSSCGEAQWSPTPPCPLFGVPT